MEITEDLEHDRRTFPMLLWATSSTDQDHHFLCRRNNSAPRKWSAVLIHKQSSDSPAPQQKTHWAEKKNTHWAMLWSINIKTSKERLTRFWILLAAVHNSGFWLDWYRFGLWLCSCEGNFSIVPVGFKRHHSHTLNAKLCCHLDLMRQRNKSTDILRILKK